MSSYCPNTLINLSRSTMMAPNRDTGDPPLPPLNQPTESIQVAQEPPDTMSQLTDPSLLPPTPLRAVLGPTDHGIPNSPEQRAVGIIDDDLYDNGYDSDGQRAPWEGIVVEDYGDEEVLEEGEATETAIAEEVEPAAGNPNPTVLTEADVMNMLVSELKTHLKNRALSVKGRKSELQERLKSAVRNNAQVVTEMDPNVAENLAGDTFDPGARWVLLEPDNDDEVEEEILEIDGVGFHGPTSDGAGKGAKRYNYTEQFDRLVFNGTAKQPKIWRNGRISLDHNRKVQYEVRSHTETIPNVDFCTEHGLDLESHPAEWFEAFLPIKNGRRGGGAALPFSIESCLSWTNTKARMQNAGLGGKYADFQDFTLDELMQHTSLYLLQGLSPSPQIDMKFKSQLEDPVNGNDLVHRVFGGRSAKSVRRHKHFKCFFACVNPLIEIPSRETHPNWKIHPLLKHMNEVSKKAVHLGQNLSCDEQTIGFQGHHKDKQRITYKNEGDGFLADCICSDGYTYNFHFRHQAPSKKLLDDGLSPLHARVVGLVSQLPNKNYTLSMDNLYNSAKFFRYLLSMDQKVMGHGVARQKGRGVPKCVFQNEVTGAKNIEKVRHTVKVAVVKGDSVCINPLVCISLYDSKPVYLLSTACSDVNWIAKKRKVWHAQKNAYVWIKFLRLNVIDFYNRNMGSVDLADQLRNHYRYDTQWHRNRKWWWAVWWWGFQVLLTNAYKVYCDFHKMHDSEAALSHYDFIKGVALAWLDRENYWPKKGRRKRTRITNAVEDTSMVMRRSTRARGNTDRTSSSRAGRNLDSSGSSTVSIYSAASSSSDGNTVVATVARNITMNDKGLQPNGSLKCRLNTYITHSPCPSANKRPKCQLHRWARGRGRKEIRGSKLVVHCSVCRVDLCFKCWKTFHSCTDIISLKEEIAES